LCAAGFDILQFLSRSINLGYNILSTQSTTAFSGGFRYTPATSVSFSINFGHTRACAHAQVQYAKENRDPFLFHSIAPQRHRVTIDRQSLGHAQIAFSGYG
jgi:hypothetical protein